MERLTKQSEQTKEYVVSAINITQYETAYSGDAIARLATFENIYEKLQTDQFKISQELEKLRTEGKSKSVKFRELLGEKLSNTYALSIFKANAL